MSSGEWLFAIGIPAYLCFQYLMYALTRALRPLFLLFIAVQTASLIALVCIVAGIDIQALAVSASERLPRRGMAVLSLLMSVLLTGMWLVRIIGAMQGGIDGALFGTTTLTVQAPDLGIVVPLAMYTAVLAWRGRPADCLL